MRDETLARLARYTIERSSHCEKMAFSHPERSKEYSYYSGRVVAYNDLFHEILEEVFSEDFRNRLMKEFQEEAQKEERFDFTTC